jgi:hypothetical protein
MRQQHHVSSALLALLAVAAALLVAVAMLRGPDARPAPRERWQEDVAKLLAARDAALQAAAAALERAGEAMMVHAAAARDWLRGGAEQVQAAAHVAAVTIRRAAATLTPPQPQQPAAHVPQHILPAHAPPPVPLPRAPVAWDVRPPPT